MKMNQDDNIQGITLTIFEMLDKCDCDDSAIELAKRAVRYSLYDYNDEALFDTLKSELRMIIKKEPEA